MTDTETLPLLLEFYREKLAAVLHHIAGARLVSQYDANNTYQYVVNREETQLAWLRTAIMDLGGPIPNDVPEQTRTGKAAQVFEDDARAAKAFIEKWTPRVEALTHARHRGMLRVILGETVEQQRFFEQALAGRDDLLGVRTEKAGKRVGSVLSTRWVE
ncbi:MAG: hypothetical protein AB7N65_00155 [Vicinamibacterales bacterium]